MAAFELTAPDGATYQLEAPNEQAAMAALGEHLGGNVSRETSDGQSLVGGAVRSAATGVPIIGGTLNTLDAATNATLAPLLNRFFDEKNQLRGDTWADRLANAKKAQDEMDVKFGKEHPIISTAAEIGGGIGSIAGAIKAAPTIAPKLLGLTGKTLPQQVAQGAVSGAALSAADAATREGGDVESGAQVGAITGAAAPVVGRLIGRGVEALRNAKRPAAVPTNITDVEGVPVRQSLGQATGDTEAIMREQMALRGADNSAEQNVARDFFDAQKRELGQAGEAVSRRLSPNGEVVATNPQDAASVIADSLSGRAATQFQTEQVASQRLAADTQALHAGLSPTGTVIAASPTEASNIVSQAVGNAAERAQAAKKQAYDALEKSDVVFHPAAFNGAGDKLRALVDKASRIDINSELTPTANAAVDKIDSLLGGLAQKRDAAGRVLPAEPITPAAIEDVRKRLNVYMTQAKASAVAGKPADAMAMRDVIDAFDDLVADRIAKGTVIQGNPMDALSQMRFARGLNTAYRKTFTPQGAGDEVGSAIQKIVGRYEGQAAPPEQIASMLYGKGALPVKVAQRLIGIFGEDSPEIGAIKQGLFAHLTEKPGLGPLEAGKAADNIDQFLKTSTLAQVYLKPGERQALADHAARLRSSIKPEATDVDRIIARVADGSLTATDLSNMLLTTKGVGRAVSLAQKIKTEFGEGSREWSAVKQGLWAKVNEGGGGPLDVGSRKVVSNLTELLDGGGKPLAHVLFSSDERDLLRSYRDLMERITPPGGTVNYSNTSSVLGKMFRGALDGVFGLGGLHVAGPLGMAAGYAADAGQRAVRDAVRATKVARSLYGTPQGAEAAGRLQDALGRLTAITARGTTPALAR
jgi:hypothetical protein